MSKYGQCEICWSSYAGTPAQRYCRTFGDACAKIGKKRIAVLRDTIRAAAREAQVASGGSSAISGGELAGSQAGEREKALD